MNKEQKKKKYELFLTSKIWLVLFVYDYLSPRSLCILSCYHANDNLDINTLIISNCILTLFINRSDNINFVYVIVVETQFEKPFHDLGLALSKFFGFLIMYEHIMIVRFLLLLFQSCQSCNIYNWLNILLWLIFIRIF